MSSISGPLASPVAAAKGVKHFFFFFFFEKEWAQVDDDDSWEISEPRRRYFDSALSPCSPLPPF